MATPRRVSRQAPQQRRAEGLSSGGFLLAALLTCAFGVGAVVAGYFWMKSSPQSADAVLAATGKSGPTIAPPTVDNGSWTDEDIKGCSDAAAAAAEVAKKRRLAAVSGDRVGLGGPDADLVQRSTYLLCGSTRKPLHLCQNYWRDWYMGAIREHAKDFNKITTSAYWTKVSVADRARKAAAGANGQQWQAVSDDLDQTTREVGKMHDGITAAFRSLITDGIIDPGDFGNVLGFGIPPDVGAMIGDARAERHLCG